MWVEKDKKLCASFRFKDVTEAFAFMTEVAMFCERTNHHPDWSNSWNIVDVQLSTHSSGGIITDKDKLLADKMEKTYRRFKIEARPE